MKREQAVQVNWKEMHRTLTLEGEPILEYVLYWPEVAGGGLGGACPVLAEAVGPGGLLESLPGAGAAAAERPALYPLAGGVAGRGDPAGGRGAQPAIYRLGDQRGRAA